MATQHERKQAKSQSERSPCENEFGVSQEYQIPDETWERIEPLLPGPNPNKKPGRPRMDDRKALTAIFYVLRNGCQWNPLPRCLGASSTVHDCFQESREAGLFERVWQAGVIEYDNEKRIDWE